MRHLIAATIAAGAILAVSASSALGVPFHQHYVHTPSGQVVPIAGGICSNELQNAIDNLHANVHLGAPTSAFAADQNPVGFSVSACP